MKNLLLTFIGIIFVFSSYSQTFGSLPTDAKESVMFVKYHQTYSPEGLKGIGKKIQDNFTKKHNATADKWNVDLEELAKLFSPNSVVVDREANGAIDFEKMKNDGIQYMIFFRWGKGVETKSYGNGQPSQHVSTEMYYTYYIQNIETGEITDLFTIKGIDDMTMGAKPKAFFKKLNKLTE